MDDTESCMGCVFAIAIIALIGTCVACLIHTVHANIAMANFVSACEEGDTATMQTFIPNYHAELSEEICRVIDETRDAANDEAYQTQQRDDSSSDGIKKDIQSVILKHSNFSKSFILTIDGKDTVDITVTGPDMVKIIDCVLASYSNETEDSSITDLTSDSLYEAIVADIASEQFTYTHTVTIPIYSQNFRWYADYDSVSVMDGLMGGLQTAYDKLYQNEFDAMMEHYGVKEGRNDAE